MKYVIKFLIEFFLALSTFHSLGSTFKERLAFIRCDRYMQERIKEKLHIK